MHSRRFPITAAIGFSLFSMGVIAAELPSDLLLKKPRPNNSPTSKPSGNSWISIRALVRHPD